MRTVALLACLTPSVALAFESEPQEVLFTDHFDVFEGAEYDSGYLPAGSPLSVRFYVDSRGGAFVEMEAESQLTWPEPLTHGLRGVPGTGYFALVTDLEMAAQIHMDLWGYKGSWDLWADTLYLADEVEFDPMLLPGRIGGAEITVEADGDGIDTIDIPVDLFTGVSLEFHVDVYPRATATIEGLRVETNGSVLDQAGATEWLDVPDDPGSIELESVFVAQYDASLAVVLEPSMEVCVIALGCYEVARFGIPIDLVSVSEEHAFEPVVYEHPLPAIDVGVSSYDFGDVLVGTLEQLELPFESLGQLDAEGWVHVEGSDDLSVYPEYLHATPGNTDGVVVSFRPSTTGLLTATLVVQTNDPLRPRIEIPLAGRGVGPQDDDGGGEQAVAHIRGCGCAAGAAPTLQWLGLGLVALVMRRRRRRASSSPAGVRSGT